MLPQEGSGPEGFAGSVSGIVGEPNVTPHSVHGAGSPICQDAVAVGHEGGTGY